MIKTGTHPSRNKWLLVPAAGSVIFILLYVPATLFYPGGSQADKAAKGFSWLNNYWCNLLHEKGINGEGLWMLKWRWLFWMGILNMLFVILNNVLYYNKPLIYALPVVQKITFLSFLIWISLISVVLYIRGKKAENAV